MFKCDSKNCSNFDIKEKIIKCNGLCNKSYHGICIGLPRCWSESRLTEMILNNFICDECIPFLANTQRILLTHEKALTTINEKINILSNAVNSTICENKDTFVLLTKEFQCYRRSYDSLDASIKRIVSENKQYVELSEKIFTSMCKSMSDIIESKVCSKLNSLATNIESISSTSTQCNKGSSGKLIASCNTTTEEKVVSLNTTVKTCETLENEMSSGWRLIGNVRRWKADWSDYDQKLKNRKQQEKMHQRASLRKKKLRKQQEISTSKNSSSTSPTNLDSQLHKKSVFNRNDSKRKSFMVKNKPTDDSFTEKMPIAVQENIRKYKEKYSNYVSGGIFQVGGSSKSDKNGPTSNSFVNPLTPPVVQQTLVSIDDKTTHLFALSRFNDNKIYDVARLYLACLHDKPPSYCINGFTATKCRVFLDNEGLPVDYSTLNDLYQEFHMTKPNSPISAKDVKEDLAAFRNHIQQERIMFLQKSNDSYKKFYTGNFQ